MTRRTWTETTCPIFGRAFNLIGLNDGESGSARRHGDTGRFVAHAFVGGHYYNFKAATVEKAMKRLEVALDRK